MRPSQSLIMAQEAFTFFWHGLFSKWHPSPFVLGGINFTHAEQFMMYAKAMLFGDREAAEQIMEAKTPKEQKALGRKVKGFDEATWLLFREGVVFDGSYAKFSQKPELRGALLATRGTTLVEASPYDQVWGGWACGGRSAGERSSAVARLEPARRSADPRPGSSPVGAVARELAAGLNRCLPIPTRPLVHARGPGRRIIQKTAHRTESRQPWPLISRRSIRFSPWANPGS